MIKIKMIGKIFTIFIVFTFFTTLAATTSIEKILNQIADKDKETVDLELQFTQEIEFSVFKETRTIEGKVVFKRPNKIFYQLFSPSQKNTIADVPQQTVVSDGKRLWIYNHQTNQVFIDLWKNWKGIAYFIPGIFNPKGKISELKKIYNFRLVGEENGSYLLLLEPKQRVRSALNLPREFKFYLWVSKEDFVPVRSKFVTEGVICTTSIDSYKTNLGPEDELFKFKAPPDAEVLRLFK